MSTLELETVIFGTIEIEKDKIVHFKHGFPGFEEHKQFILIPISDEVPFSYLQGIDDTNLAFLVSLPFDFFPTYEFVLSNDLKEELQIETEDQVVVLTIVTVQESLNDATVNLLAPIIINQQAGIGKQIVLHDSEYTTKQRLLPEQAVGERV